MEIQFYFNASSVRFILCWLSLKPARWDASPTKFPKKLHEGKTAVPLTIDWNEAVMTLRKVQEPLLQLSLCVLGPCPDPTLNPNQTPSGGPFRRHLP